MDSKQQKKAKVSAQLELIKKYFSVKIKYMKVLNKINAEITL